MTSWKIKLNAAREYIPVLEDILQGLDPEGFPTLSDFEIEKDDEIRLLEAFFLTKPDLTLFQDRLARALPDLDPASLDVSLAEIEEKDWVSESQKLLQPVDAGPFFVHGGHDADKIPPDRISLLMEAGQAFGTGQHETTHGCLLAIADLAAEWPEGQGPKTALDLGCGSGLLALAMSRLWPITIIASDIDPIATETTILNAAANHINVVEDRAGQPGVAVLTSDGFSDKALIAAGPYDVIVANILAQPLQDMAADIVANLTEGGALILSGLLDVQESAVLSAYESRGMRLVKRYPRGEWRSLRLTRA